ncbi:TRIC cation channel family protein, partial [Paenibacillus sepulcri]|nr:TRIC cation channel family protein [Paenibacillus sepulcri]
VIVAAMLTGIGGGMIRDVLAGRKPLVLRDEIYAVWAMAAGAAIGLGWFTTTLDLLFLFVIVIVFRMLSVHYRWRLPRRSLKFVLAQSVYAEELQEERAAEAKDNKEKEGHL